MKFLDLLAREGFIESEIPKTFTRGNWTIRFDCDLIEIFNDPDKAPGKYYCGPIEKTNLQDIIDEIINFEYNIIHDEVICDLKD